MTSAENKAVFLSYAREDAAAARRIAEALRASGVEVWFDESELRGGDSWDAKIRQQIRECALFMPIISASTQARAEGYFRVEWRLADRRTESIGKSKSFLVPVCLDVTAEACADVPDSFLAVQWTRLPAGETPRAFCERVRTLLQSAADSRGPSPTRPVSGPPTNSSSAQKRPPATRAPRTVIAWALAVLAVASVSIWQPWRNSARKPPVPGPVSLAALSPTAAEVARLRARLIPNEWKKEDFEPWSAALDRIIAADDQNAEAWALRSIIYSLLVVRSYESGTRPLQEGGAAANRAMHLAPGSGLAELAMAFHHSAMISRGGDPHAPKPFLRRALAQLPADALTRFAQMISAYLAYDFAEMRQILDAWLAAEPSSHHAQWSLGLLHLANRRPAEALQWADRAASDRDISAARAFVTVFEVHYYLTGDLPAARAALQRIPPGAPVTHRSVFSRWLLAMAERRWDIALQELARTPEPTLFDRTYHGPKALLAGLAHHAAGRHAAAESKFTDAERVLREQLAADPQNEELHAAFALTLACLRRSADAERELALVEPLVRGRARTLFTGQIITLVAQTHAMLGDAGTTVAWLRELLSGPTSPPFTPVSLRFDPRFQFVIKQPEGQALLAEFAHLDAKTTATAKSEEKSIAVLAFKATGQDKESEIFSDGISEEVANVLAQIPGLRVAARPSAFYFKGKDATAQEIGQKLNVAYLVDGSVQREGAQVRVTARLSRTDTGNQVWGDKFDGELRNIFALQDDIAGRIADNLKLKLGYAPRIARVVNPGAYRLLLEGRYFWNLRSIEGFEQAEVAITKALALDPNFAQAHAALADVYNIRTTYALQDGRIERPEPQAIGKARAEAQRAIELDATLADAYPALAYCAFLEMRFAEAEQHFQKALALNPNNAVAHAWHATLLLSQGRLREGLGRYEKATSLDPLWAVNMTTQGEVLNYARRYEEALAVSDRVLALKPDYVPNLGNRARTLFALGRGTEAIDVARMVRRMPEKTPRRDADGSAIWVLKEAGFTAEAVAYGETLLRTLPASSQQRGFVLGALGRFADALPYLERTPPVIRRRLYWDPMWDRYRDDPRFGELLVKLGCVEEYNAARNAVEHLPPYETPAKK